MILKQIPAHCQRTRLNHGVLAVAAVSDRRRRSEIDATIYVASYSVMSQKIVEVFSPSADGRQPVAHGASRGSRSHPRPRPLSRRAGEGCRRRGEGPSTQGLRPGLLYAAPDGALKNAGGGDMAFYVADPSMPPSTHGSISLPVGWSMARCPNRAGSDVKFSRLPQDHRAWAGKNRKIRGLVDRRVQDVGGLPDEVPTARRAAIFEVMKASRSARS